MDDADGDIDRARRGDASAISALFQRHLPALRAWLRLRGGGVIGEREACSDLVQSVCLEVLENLESFEDRGEAAFRHWLFTLASRKITEKRRFHWAQKRDSRRQRASVEELAVTQTAFGSPSRAAIVREKIERLESLIRQLPEHEREVLLLSRLIGLRHDEIASRTGRSVAAVRTALCRGLARLAPILADDDG